MTDLSGKAFLITGGNGGIGLGMAEGIAAAGGSLVIWGRKDDKNAEAVAGLRAMGAEAEAFVCDVADEEQVIDTMRRSVDVHGRLDGVFANAGRSGTGHKFVDLSLDDWRAVMSVNRKSVV